MKTLLAKWKWRAGPSGFFWFVFLILFAAMDAAMMDRVQPAAGRVSHYFYLANLALCLWMAHTLHRFEPDVYWKLFFQNLTQALLLFLIFQERAFPPGMDVFFVVFLLIRYIFPFFLVLYWLALAVSTPLPLNSPLAPVFYLGRYGHLQELERLAKKLKWNFQGPTGRYHRVALSGEILNRPVLVVSDFHPDWIYGTPSRFTLAIIVRSERQLYPMLTGHKKAVRNKRLFRPISIEERSELQSYVYYLQDLENHELTGEEADPLGRVLVSGTRHLAYGEARLFSDRDHLILRRKHFWKIPDDALGVEQTIRWMCMVAEVMETRGYSAPAQEEAAAPEDGTMETA